MKVQKNAGEEKMRKKIVYLILVMVFALAGIARADTVELDLFTLGCQTNYGYDLYWTSDFDLGTSFSQIDRVYIDWAGEITAGMAINYGDPCNPYPMDVGIGCHLESPPSWKHTDFWGGSSTHPAPESFDCQLEFIHGTMPWSELYDGQSTITIGYMEAIMLDGRYIEHGSVTLTRATLVVEGTVVPEPVTALLFTTGMVIVRLKYRKNNR